MPFSKLTNSTGKHKDWYTPEYLRLLCQQIDAQDKLLSKRQICQRYKKSYEELELKARLALIAQLLDEAIELPYPKQLDALANAFGEPLETETGMFTEGFYLYPHSMFVELYAERDLAASLEFIRELTQRFTGEWAIRTVANADEKLTLKTVKLWAKDKNFHVRRWHQKDCGLDYRGDARSNGSTPRHKRSSRSTTGCETIGFSTFADRSQTAWAI